MEFEDSLVRDLLAYQKESKAEGCRDPFCLPFPGRQGCVPDELKNKLPNLDAAFGATVSLSLRSEYSLHQERLAYAVNLCESPIEARFLLSLICSCGKHELSVVVEDGEGEPLFATETNAWMEMTLYVYPKKTKTN